MLLVYGGFGLLFCGEVRCSFSGGVGDVTLVTRYNILKSVLREGVHRFWKSNHEQTKVLSQSCSPSRDHGSTITMVRAISLELERCRNRWR